MAADLGNVTGAAIASRGKLATWRNSAAYSAAGGVQGAAPPGARPDLL